MTEKTFPVKGNISFADLQSLNEHGAEFWSARELQPLLGDKQWWRFEDAIKNITSSNTVADLIQPWYNYTHK